jgi:hypothetical protein
MSDNAIKLKLQAHLENHWPLSEECHVVYVMVELRKAVERSRKDLRLLRFYANWTLHTSKDRDNDPVYGDADALYLEARARLPAWGAPAFERFVGMTKLKAEIAEILGSLGINPEILVAEENWREFVRLLTDVLVDQPITFDFPNPMIEIRFEEGDCVVKFTEPSGEDSVYRHPRRKGV